MMKLSVSTYGWSALTWTDFLTLAEESHIVGLEIHNVDDPRFTGANGAFRSEVISERLREAKQAQVEMVCVDARCNPIDVAHETESVAEITERLQMAHAIHAPFVRIRAAHVSGMTDEAEDQAVMAVMRRVIPLAESLDVTLLIESVGPYADTARLMRVLDEFAHDALAALWDVHHPYRFAGEAPEQTLKNLGAAIRHVHVKDSVCVDATVEYRLPGEGDLPLDRIFNALRSINYEGYCSLEWDPEWQKELDDPSMILAHFAHFMSRFEDRQTWQTHLYDNRAHTGRYVWKKDILIDLTFPQVLDRMVEEFPDQIAFKYTTLDYTRTYSEFREDVDRFARALVALGVKKGSKVAVWATNVPQWYITFWATTKIGAILVTMNTAYKIAEAEYLLKQSDTHTLVMVDGYRDADYVDIIRRLCPELAQHKADEPLHAKRLPFLRRIITVGYREPGCLTWAQALAYARQTPLEEVARRASEMRPDDVCNMQYTSGTTGFPKGVMLTHRGVVNNGKCIGDRMDLSTADRMMIQVPMFHCFGMVLAMTASMTHGASLYPLPYFSPKPALSCIHREHITCFHGVPTMFIAMLAHEDFARTDFSHMRTGIMAGSNCPESVMRDVADRMNMTGIVSVYGQTESSPGCTMSRCYEDSLDVRASTVGPALPEVECKIIDPATGKDVPDGMPGEFVARGYNIMKGYYKMPAETAEAIDRDGWLHTGDICVRDPDGNYRVTGRLKDMIIRGGENVYPREIEEFIYTHPKVSDVQVIGVPDPRYGEEIMACVILKEGETMTEQDLKDFVSANMARHKTPRYVWFMDRFIMNDAGKIQKYKMREKAVEQFHLAT